MDKSIIVLKNGTLFVDGQQYDAFALAAVKEDESGKLHGLQSVNGKFNKYRVGVLLEGILRIAKTIDEETLKAMKGV